MQVFLATVKSIVNSSSRLVECNLNYSNNNVIARCAFFNIDIKPGDRVIVFVSNAHGFMEAIALPLENKFEQTLDNVRVSYEDNYADWTASDIAIQVAQDAAIQMDADGISIVKTQEEHSKIHGEFFMTNSSIEVYKSDPDDGDKVKSSIRLNNDSIEILKGDDVGEASSSISIKDDEIKSKNQNSYTSIKETEIKIESQNVVVPGMPKADASQSKGGFCQILYCPLTGLPHNTDTVLGIPQSAPGQQHDTTKEEVRTRITSRRRARG